MPDTPMTSAARRGGYVSGDATVGPTPAPVGPAPGAQKMPERYPEVERFAALMRAELAANSGKGDQAGWLAASPDALLHDITWHWAKLAMVWRDRRHLDGYCRDPKACTDPHKDREQVDQRLREHAADVANMSLMFLDRLGLLPEVPDA